MPIRFDRRQFARAVPALGLLPFMRRAEARQESSWPTPLVMPPPVDEAYPTHHAALAKEIVGAAHTNLPRVRELVGKYPTLVKAGWDWGWGDWETPLGSASHVGHRAIAEFLLEQGAGPTIFSAAMLGQLDAVKAFAAAMPNVHTLRGPHGITLLAHAKAGGANAAGVVSFLESLGSDRPYVNEPVAAADQKAIVGTYVFGSGARDRFVIDVQRDQLGIARVGATRRGLIHIGGLAFHPPGAPNARITFEQADGRAIAMTIADSDLVLRAARVE